MTVESSVGRDVAQRLVEAVESADAGALAGLFGNDAVMRHPLAPEPIEGRAAIAASEQALFDAFSDIAVEVLRVVVSGDDVALEVVLRATNTGPLDVGADESIAPTGRRIEIPSVWFLTIDAEQDHFDHARHNEAFLDYLIERVLSSDSRFADWALVVCFYAALHFTKAAILRDHNEYSVAHLTTM